MTREEFIEILNRRYYSWASEGNNIVITDRGEIDLDITSIPPNVEFRNDTYVYLDSLKSLPPNIKFKNRGSVSLYALNSIPPEITFENGRGVWLDSFGIDTKDAEEENNVLNIEGINPKRILNQMISIGLLDREKR
jgi:hypothetical protein